MRYKEYNANRVLDKAISLFWKKGFNGCSINELVEETNVNRFSLYHEFDNKEGILYSSMKIYRQRYCSDKLIILKEEGDLLDILKRFYLSFLENDNTLPGCYFIHVGTELADTDAGVKNSLKEYLDEINCLFVDLLCKSGFAESEANLKAKHLVGLYCTAMSFCLIHSPKERVNYIMNEINIILPSYA